MKSYKKIMDHVLHDKVKTEVWEEVTDLTDKLFVEIEPHMPGKIKEYLKKIEDILLYPPFTEQEARAVVAGFVNKDGTRGAHWSIEQVREVAKNKPELKEFDCYDFFIALNMMYSDYYQAKFNTEDYICMAVDFLKDEDAPKSKVRRYIKAMKD